MDTCKQNRRATTHDHALRHQELRHGEEGAPLADRARRRPSLPRFSQRRPRRKAACRLGGAARLGSPAQSPRHQLAYAQRCSARKGRRRGQCNRRHARATRAHQATGSGNRRRRRARRLHRGRLRGSSATSPTRCREIDVNTPHSPTVELAFELIRRPSVTPDDGGCQELVAARRAPLGFTIEPMPFGEVKNLWARRGTARPLLTFAGHTDVVPPGPLDKWLSPPFAPEIRDGMLYGRGAADMKGSIAAMVTACERFIAAHPDHRGAIAFLLTSDEEGPSVDGTVKVGEVLEKRGEKIDWCVVGEPSSSTQVGDVVKNGRRGSLNGRLRVLGVQGHVANPHLADNPNHRAAPAQAELAASEWDRGNEIFQAPRILFCNIHGGTGAEYGIPGKVDLLFNFRYSTALTADGIKRRVHDVLDRHGLRYELQWKLSGEPFLTGQGELTEDTRAAERHVSGLNTELSTAGGPSAGRYIAPTGAQEIELGPLNATNQ